MTPECYALRAARPGPIPQLPAFLKQGAGLLRVPANTAPDDGARAKASIHGTGASPVA